MSLIRKRKGQFLFAGLLLILALTALYFWKPVVPWEDPTPELKLEKRKAQPKSTSTAPQERRIIQDDHRPVKTTTLLPQNTPSPKWKSSLQKSLIKQGGRDLKDLTITPLESLIWVHEGRALNVETARISFTTPEGNEISFKTMVDSQTGKILQTWDQPVIDDFSREKKSGVKLDPRYLGQ
jgi:hypothetical protein